MVDAHAYGHVVVQKHSADILKIWKISVHQHYLHAKGHRFTQFILASIARTQQNSLHPVSVEDVNQFPDFVDPVV